MNEPGDREVVAAQIGRPPRAESTPVSRCHLGLPVVIRVPPLLEDGTPFPTLYWLTCPLATARIGRLEAAGGIKRLEQKAEVDPQFGDELDAAHSSYARERDLLVPAGASLAPSGGVGGTREGIKCLHAHYAHTRAGGDNPVGSLVSDWIEPLDCTTECVMGGVRNPAWAPRP